MSHRRRSKNEIRGKREAHRRELAAEQRKRVFFGVGLIVAAFVVIAVLLSLPLGPGFPQGAPTVGHVAPDFVIVDINGVTFRLSAQIGHPVLLDFMGSNCPTCVAEMPELRSVYSTYSARGLAMISIDVGGSLGTQDPNVARTFMTTNGGSWPIALDNSNVGLRYGVVSLPTLYIIDPAGNVAFRNAGTTSASTMGAVISRYV
jgi:peroxiredoxin